jgi:hypothetical protein
LELLERGAAMMRSAGRNFVIGCIFMFYMDIEQRRLNVICLLPCREILSGKSWLCLQVFEYLDWPGS